MRENIQFFVFWAWLTSLRMMFSIGEGDQELEKRLVQEELI
jgi:hypothetical protein